jgi:hypothetical protein
LALAYRQLRWEAITTVASERDDVNVLAVKRAIRDAREALNQLCNARAGVWKATKELTGVSSSLNDIELKLAQQLSIIDANSGAAPDRIAA